MNKVNAKLEYIEKALAQDDAMLVNVENYLMVDDDLDFWYNDAPGG